MDLKNVKRGRITEYAEKFKGAEYLRRQAARGASSATCAFPCATQNEINGEDAETLVKNGCYLRRRGRQHADRLPTASTSSSTHKILYGPGKAANAGGVATSGLEMAQNAMRLSWTPRGGRHRAARHHEEPSTSSASTPPTSTARPGNYVNGANIAGFIKVADAMLDQGVV